MRTSNYVRYLGLQYYEPGMQYDAHECLLQLLAKIYPNINDDCVFKINKLDSNDCGHTTNNESVCIDWSLHLEDSSNVQTISGMLHQLMDPRGEYLQNYRYVDGCQKLNTSTKAVYVTQLPNALIIQINIFKYIAGISKKFIPNLSIDEEISLWGNRMVLSAVINHEGEQSHCGYYTSGVNVDNMWFLISDTRILRQQKLQCSSRDISAPFILIYKKKSNFLVAPPNSLNGTSRVSFTSAETAETIIQQSVLLELENQKAKLSMEQQKQKINSSKVKSPVNRKSKFTNRSFRENYKNRNKFMRDNFGEDEKEQLKKLTKKKERSA